MQLHRAVHSCDLARADCKWSTFRANMFAAYAICSDQGSTRGLRVVMLAFRERPAMLMSSFDRYTPTCQQECSVRAILGVFGGAVHAAGCTGPDCGVA